MRAIVENILNDCFYLTDIVVELIPGVYFFLLASDGVSEQCA